MRPREKRVMTETRAARIKRLRMALPPDDAGQPITQAALARRLGVSVASVARWENGTRSAFPRRSEDRAKLAHALGVSLRYLLTGAESTAIGHGASDRRRPVLAPLRRTVSEIERKGDTALADFIAQVIRLAATLKIVVLVLVSVLSNK